MFNISEKAANEIKKLLLDEDDKTMFLRVRVVPGGVQVLNTKWDSTMKSQILIMSLRRKTSK